jgi:E3 ubiquitin-protein ligase UBR3
VIPVADFFLVADPEKNFHFVIDCAKKVMKEHCYWPLVSDFNNVLSHERVALVFLRDDDLIDMWFQFLSMLQGKLSLMSKANNC